jgi:glycosyltransferase involved in cell wall biosynthesis
MSEIGNDNKKTKLLVTTPSLECGGSERFVSILCNNISVEKFDVTLIVLNNANPFYKINRSAVKVIDLKTPTVRQSFFKIRKVIKSVKPDVIFTTANHLNLFFAIFKKMLTGNIKIIARESSIVSFQKKQEKFTWLFNRLLKLYYKRLDFILCQSAYMQQDLIKQYKIKKEKTIIINNPIEIIDVDLPINDLSKAGERTYKFITVARLSKEKGLARLIDAVSYLKIPFTYHIIGEGIERKQLEQLIIKKNLQGRVILEGAKKQPYQNMQNADFFLMGSYHEGFPNAVIEAGILGIPVIAFDAPGGLKDIIIVGENGLLVKHDDIIVFADTIEIAIEKNFNKNNIRNQTCERFSVLNILNRVEQLFTKIAES